MSDTEMPDDRATPEQIAQLTAEQRARITDAELALFTRAQINHLLSLSPDQITQTLHPGAPPQPPQPALPRVSQPLDPNARPTPARLAREEKTKKRKRNGPDDDAERANEIRSLVHTADNRHLKETIIPFDERPNAADHTTYHVAHWQASPDPCVVDRLPNFDVQATAITLEDALAFNQSKEAWLNLLRQCADERDADTGFACLVLVLDQVIKFDEIPTMRDRIQEGFSRMCQSDGITAVAPQPTTDARDGHPNFSPFAFFMRLSLENALGSAAGYAWRIKWPECPDGITVTVLLPDHAPPTHVGSYEDIRGLPPITPAIERSIRANFQQQIADRFPEKITDFLRANNARLWGGGQLAPWWCELLQASIRIKVWESKGSDGKTSVTIAVYCLGVFDTTWHHRVWEEALLGEKIQLGEYGNFPRTPTHRKKKCSICHDRDHHARVCPIWHHPQWPEDLRQRRAARIAAEKGRERTPEPSGSSRGFRGAPRGRGGRGRGGGHHDSYGPPPPPFPYGYPPPYPYNAYGAPPNPYGGYGYDKPSRGSGSRRGNGRGRG